MIGAGPTRWSPLRIEAEISGPIDLAGGAVAFDALLAAAVALRENLPPPDPAHLVDIEVPLAREPDGRFHLASFAEYQVEQRERHWLNRRFPIAEAQVLAGSKLRRIDVKAGPQRSYRLPREMVHLVDGLLTWHAVGDPDAVRALLALVPYVGKKRSCGLGRVREWRVAECALWPVGFPVVRDGLPLRPLPPDWPGLAHPVLAYRTLTYPYWRNDRRALCAVPDEAWT